jgi:predicted acyltransferase (DUF342 family)
MKKKYKLTKNTRTYCGRTLYQIEALKDFGSVTKGERGGYIEKESNLSQEGNAWVSDNAKVFEDAEVSGNALVMGDAEVYGGAEVYGEAILYDECEVYESAKVFGEARLYDKCELCGYSEVYGNARIDGYCRVGGDANVCGTASVGGNARIDGKAFYKKGDFIGGDDSGKITDITEKTGSDYYKNQYVLGDYEIIPIEEEVSLSGKEVEINIDGKTYKATIN